MCSSSHGWEWNFLDTHFCRWGSETISRYLRAKFLPLKDNEELKAKVEKTKSAELLTQAEGKKNEIELALEELKLRSIQMNEKWAEGSL